MSSKIRNRNFNNLCGYGFSASYGFNQVFYQPSAQAPSAPRRGRSLGSLDGTAAPLTRLRNCRTRQSWCPKWKNVTFVCAAEVAHGAVWRGVVRWSSGGEKSILFSIAIFCARNYIDTVAQSIAIFNYIIMCFTFGFSPLVFSEFTLIILHLHITSTRWRLLRCFVVVHSTANSNENGFTITTGCTRFVSM